MFATTETLGANIYFTSLLWTLPVLLNVITKCQCTAIDHRNGWREGMGMTVFCLFFVVVF